jgi:YgiT-type zinc finger domain-containing protein
MPTNSKSEILIEQKVTYRLEVNGQFFIIENVPARVCIETGERFFAPEDETHPTAGLFAHRL